MFSFYSIFRQHRATRRRQPAQSLVEFSVISAFILVPLLLGIVDLGRVYYYDMSVSAAAMEGARAAAGGLDSSISTRVSASAPSLVSVSSPTVTPSACSSRTASPTPTWVTVSVSASFTPISPYVAALIGNPYTVTRSVSQLMRVNCVSGS